MYITVIYESYKNKTFIYDSFERLMREDKYDNIVHLRCVGNIIKLPELPKSLKFLECYNNKLTNLPELPKLLLELNCNNNKIIELPELPKSLRFIDCNYNKLTSLPKSLIDCRNLDYITYSGNELELTMQQMNFINRIRNRSYLGKTIYDDGQNIHNSGIQKCVYDNIQILMEDD